MANTAKNDNPSKTQQNKHRYAGRKRKEYTTQSVMKILSKKRDVEITSRGIEIRVGPKAKQDLGNKSWGKIDFLSRAMRLPIIRIH